jgi:predicted  nucleic acid-binding Zn-ribbon protein
MGFEIPKLRRSLFGYRKEAINQLLAERNEFYIKAEDRVHAAEARIADLERELASARAETAALHQELEKQRTSDQGTARFLTEELSTILAAAEESATRIIERARTSTQHQIDEAGRMWSEVQGEVTRFAGWRERLDPAIKSAQTRLVEVRTQAEETPDRIRRALSPLAEAISSLSSDLTGLESATQPSALGPGSSSATSEYLPPTMDIA